MLCIYLEETDPDFCLATEEYLLKNYREDIFMVWQSENAVIVGKHQNTLGEIDYRFIMENGIKVARRISGGGAVFHDSGNVNFSLLKNVASTAEISFQKFIQPMREALTLLGVNAVVSNRNDLRVAGKKISGNAEHVYKNRVLHHGTLLFNSDLMRMGKALRVVSGKYTGKAVASNPSEVTNISDFLNHSIPVEGFINHLLDFQLKQSGESHLYSLPDADREAIRKLSAEKFMTWEWQYGYSPGYIFTNASRIGSSALNVYLEIEKGMIRRVSLSGDFYPEEDAAGITELLLHKAHRFESVENAHRDLGLQTDGDLLYAYF